jgi:hypothetical protein
VAARASIPNASTKKISPGGIAVGNPQYGRNRVTGGLYLLPTIRPFAGVLCPHRSGVASTRRTARSGAARKSAPECSRFGGRRLASELGSVPQAHGAAKRLRWERKWLQPLMGLRARPLAARR